MRDSGGLVRVDDEEEDDELVEDDIEAKQVRQAKFPRRWRATVPV
jgi:hypothetical protein